MVNTELQPFEWYRWLLMLLIAGLTITGIYLISRSGRKGGFNDSSAACEKRRLKQKRWKRSRIISCPNGERKN